MIFLKAPPPWLRAPRPRASWENPRPCRFDGLANQPLAACDLRHRRVTQCLGFDGPLTDRSQAVVTASFIVQLRVGPFVGLLNHARFQQALDRTIQGTWPHFDSSL